MKILLLNTYDRGGGAEKVALDLARAYTAAGHEARLLVRNKRGDAAEVFEADPFAYGPPWAPALAALEPRVRGLGLRGSHRAADWLRLAAVPARLLDQARGVEDFNYPYARHLVNGGWRPDLIHAHNLHGDYFDLRALAPLSQQIPVVWTLHDAWAFTGHCAYPTDCPRWRSGCGNCPDLRRPPALRRDNTAANWQRKREIYASSRLAVATPSRWLMDQVEQSMLRPYHSQVIANGVDLQIYKPADKRAARAALGLPQDAFICMFIAFGATTTNPYKDVTTIGRAVRLAAERAPSAELHFVCVGRSEGAVDNPRFHYPGYIADPAEVARYYQAADVLLHAANAENFPCVIMEAMACGTPVIATAVGGIGEQIEDGVSGFLVARGDSTAMADRVGELLADPARARRMGAAAAAFAGRHGLEQQAGRYLAWFDQLREEYHQELHSDLRR